jgi:hypothetical protein
MHGSMKKFVTTHGHAWACCLGLTKKFVTTVTPGGRAAQRCGGLVPCCSSLYEYDYHIVGISRPVRFKARGERRKHYIFSLTLDEKPGTIVTIGLCESPSR